MVAHRRQPLPHPPSAVAKGSEPTVLHCRPRQLRAASSATMLCLPAQRHCPLHQRLRSLFVFLHLSIKAIVAPETQSGIYPHPRHAEYGDPTRILSAATFTASYRPSTTYHRLPLPKHIKSRIPRTCLLRVPSFVPLKKGREEACASSPVCSTPVRTRAKRSASGPAPRDSTSKRRAATRGRRTRSRRAGSSGTSGASTAGGTTRRRTTLGRSSGIRSTRGCTRTRITGRCGGGTRGSAGMWRRLIRGRGCEMVGEGGCDGYI